MSTAKDAKITKEDGRSLLYSLGVLGVFTVYSSLARNNAERALQVDDAYKM